MPVSTRIFTPAEARAIQRSFEWAIVQDEDALKKSELVAALRGVYTPDHLAKMETDELNDKLDEIMQSLVGYSSSSRKTLARKFLRLTPKKREVFVHADSMSAWAKTAVERYGLEARDIKKLAYGATVDVLIFDRNLGDSTAVRPGAKYDPTKQKGPTRAQYTHSHQYRGTLIFTELGIVRPCWDWEVNSVRRESGMYWAPLCTDATGKPRKPVPGRLKVGWRGPAVDLAKARKHLPKTVRHYDTWWDDYGAYSTTDLLKIKRAGD